MSNDFYNKNPLLKGIGKKINYTEEQLKEFLLCKDEPIYFIKKYCKIISLDHEEPINFDLFDYQKRFLTSIHDNRKVVSLQPRQMGKTTTVAAYILYCITFTSNYTCAILANKAAISREILARVKLMYEFLPDWIKQGVKKWNEGSIEFENGSKAFSAATTKSGLRGKSCNMIYIDEAAIIPNNIAEDFFTAIYPIISAGKNTKVILTSTPLGYNHFWKYWNESIKGTNGFVPIEVKYQEHPERDEAWAEFQKKLLGDVKYNQEVLCHFLGSTATLISGDKLSKMSSVPFVYVKDDHLSIIEYPEENRNYFISVDTSEGVGGDYSAFSVIDITKFPYKVVAKYKNNKISHLIYPNIIFDIAKKYNESYVLVEINSVGIQVAQILHDELEYENLLMVASQTKIGQHLSYHNKANYGIKTTKQVKRIGCQTLKTLIEEDKLLIFDEDIIMELTNFVEAKGSYQADEGYHDDLVMTLVLFAWATQDTLFKELTNSNARKQMFERQLLEIEQDMLPVGFYNDGQPETEVLANF